MITKQKAVYYFEYCNKNGLHAGHMRRHEEFCSSNPKTWAKCSDCVFCKKVPKEYQINDDDYGRINVKTHGFFCEKKQTGMYPLKAIKKGLLGKYPDMFYGEILMPNKCDEYNDGLDEYRL